METVIEQWSNRIAKDSETADVIHAGHVKDEFGAQVIIDVLHAASDELRKIDQYRIPNSEFRMIQANVSIHVAGSNQLQHANKLTNMLQNKKCGRFIIKTHTIINSTDILTINDAKHITSIHEL